MKAMLISIPILASLNKLVKTGYTNVNILIIPVVVINKGAWISK